MEEKDISFTHKGKEYHGKLVAVHGAGADVWHLMVEKFYWGRLRRGPSGWVFDATPTTKVLETFADYFGSQVTGSEKG